jgi:hypothetical protein
MDSVESAVLLGRELRQERRQNPVRFATVVSVDLGTGVATVRPSTASATDGSQDIPARYLSAAPAVGAVVRLEVYQGDVLILGAVGVDDYPGQPFAYAAGQVTVTVSGGSVSGTQAVAFPAGRFTVAPLVVISGSGTTSFVGSTSGVSTSGFTATARHMDNTTGGGSPVLTWHAIQMTSTTAAG